jgi:serine/threonine protein kinase
MAIQSKYTLEKYQYGTDVRKEHQLYGMSGKIIYNAKWKSRRVDPIIIVEMSEQIAEREAQFYLEVNSHNNIIRTLGYIENDLNLTIFIQEFAEHNDLGSVLMDNEIKLAQPIFKEMFVQIADAMSYVASKKIIHGDLGCRNVLVFRVDPSEPKNILVKLTDFGLARWTDRPPANENRSVNPIRFCAPEILRNNHHSSYSEKSDVYSMGVLIWEALSNGAVPYSSVAKDEDVTQKKLANETLPRPNICTRQLWDLMNKCWQDNPNRRPSFEEIKKLLFGMELSDNTDVQSTISSHE